MENIIITNQMRVQTLIRKIVEQGKDSLHVLADFDRTLTKAFYKGQKAGSIISQLRREKGRYLTPDYAEKAQKLFNKYHPIEINPKIPFIIKKKKMFEWWKAHIQLLIDSGFDRQIVQQSVRDMIEEKSLVFREGVEDFLNYLNENKIPLIIMTSGLKDLIEEFMKQKGLLTKNIHVVGNSFKFGKNGKAIGIKRIIHVFSKNEMSLEHLPIYKQLLKRRNVILLGDSVGDIDMVEGFQYDNLIKIGFLNDFSEDNLREFKRVYDVLILKDGDFSYVNSVMERLNKFNKEVEN